MDASTCDDADVRTREEDTTMGEPGFPQAFAEALVRRGVSLAWLQERLVERGHPVSPAALSYWRSGRSQPERGTSLEALVEIERLLRVEPGHLVDRLGPSRRPGPRPGEKNIRDLFDEAPAMQRALTELGFEGLFDELVEHLRHITIDLDDQGRATAIQVRAVMVARRDGARRTPLIVTLDDHDEMPVFVPIAGCAFGKSCFDATGGVFAVELLMDRELRKDESALYELRIELPTPSDDRFFDHYAARRLAELLIWVRFDRKRLPARVESFRRIDDVEDSEPIDLGGGLGAHALARGFGPGLLGVRWAFEED
jgi:hypothetical protein